MIGIKKSLIGLIIFICSVPLQLLNAQDTTNTITNQESVTIEDLTALDVINKYVDATGRREKYLSVYDRTIIVTGEIMGREFSVAILQKTPDKLRKEIQVGPANQTVIFDGTRAVIIMGDNTIPLDGNELNKTKIEAQMNFLLDPEACGVTPQLLGIEMVDSTQCYKISMAKDSSTTWVQYYDINSGLKIKEIRNIETPGGKFIQGSYYDDYRDVDGIKYPFKIKQTLGMQSAEMNVLSIKVNAGLDDKLFETPE